MKNQERIDVRTRREQTVPTRPSLDPENHKSSMPKPAPRQSSPRALDREAEIRKFVSDHLPRYKAPQSLIERLQERIERMEQTGRHL